MYSILIYLFLVTFRQFNKQQTLIKKKFHWWCRDPYIHKLCSSSRSTIDAVKLLIWYVSVIVWFAQQLKHPIVRLSIWQWPILFTCEKCYCLCVLRWLIRSILALNCLLQVEQQRSEQDSSVDDALALAVLGKFLLGFAESFCLIFASTSSDKASPLCSVLCNLFPRLCWYVEILEGGPLSSLAFYAGAGPRVKPWSCAILFC